MDVSVIIVSWNTKALLARCLAQLEAACDGLDVEVFVVDNGSTDGSVELVREHFPQVRLFANRQNLGFVRANNQALPLAQGEFVLLLNSDAFVEPSALRELVGFLRSHSAAGAAGPRLNYPDGSLQRSCTAFPTVFDELCLMLQLDRLFPRSRLFGRFWLSGWDYSAVREVDVVMGACLLVRRRVVEQVGLLDEAFFMYSEEVDWCYRIRRAGWRLYLVPQARATHIWGGSTGPVRVEAFIHLFRSRLIFFRKHRSRLAAATVKLVFVVGSLLRLVAATPLALLARLQQQPAHPKLIGYWRLLWALPTL
jgi:GT2 family glycosyltransferase